MDNKVERKEQTLLAVKEGIIPFLIQFGVLVVVILEFVFLIANESFANLPFIRIDEARGNNPNLARFIYMFLTIPVTVLLAVAANRADSVKKGFWLGVIAGIVAWQGVGECSWHFGVNTENGYMFFPKIEGVEGTFVLLLFLPLLIYLLSKGDFAFGLKTFVLSFFCNWIGHWLILGIGPYFAANEHVWHKIAGFGIGGLSTLYLLYRLFFVAKTAEERYTISLLLYTAVGMFVEGGFGVGASME